MGGDIKIMTRFSDGTVEGDVRHTNMFPFWVRHPRFIEGDEAWFRQYVDMPSEYKEGDNTFVPDEYGTVVFDFKTRTVFVCNNYSHLVTTGLFPREYLNSFGTGKDEADEDVFREMLAKGYLHVVAYDKGGDRTNQKRIDIPGVTVETWDKEVAGRYYGDKNETEFFYSVGIDYVGWTIKHYDVCVSGHDQLRQDLLTAGFTFTPEDQSKYAEWRAEQVALEAENAAEDI